jgi:hypothetical protein
MPLQYKVANHKFEAHKGNMKNRALTLDTVIFIFALGAMGASILIQHIGIFPN